jgi:type II secretory pathway pseudopilin PulG
MTYDSPLTTNDKQRTTNDSRELVVISHQSSVACFPSPLCRKSSVVSHGRRGFTLIEIVTSVGVVVLLMVAVIIILNPTAQFAKGRNAQRKANLNMMINAIGQNVADNKGSFSCSSGSIPTSTTRMASSSGNYNIAPCLVPTYLPSLPHDPSTSTAKWVSTSSYDTGYTIVRSATTSRVTVSAPAAELGETITYTR